MLFTRREKPGELGPLEGSQSRLRVLRLTRLEPKPCEQLRALQRTVRLFVCAYNQRHLYHWRSPAYPAFPLNFISPVLQPPP